MAESEALVNSTTRHQVYLERLKSSEANQFASFLKQIDASIRERLAGDELTELSQRRLERLLASVDKDLQTLHKAHADQLSRNLLDIAEYEAGFEARNIDNAVMNYESVIPSTNQIKAAVLSAPLSVRGGDGGKLLKAFIDDWSEAEVKRVTGAIRQGAFEGQTNAQIKQRVRGTRANKFSDGLLAISSRNADAVVRTAVQHVASEARFETWKENSIVKAYRWISTLDSRTTQQCRSLDGQVFKLGKGPTPPIHIRCRSTTVAELDERFAFLEEGRTRASKDGPVDGGLSYYEWLKRQPAAFQDDAIGKARGKLFRDGGLSAERFAELNLGRNFTPLTLEQMRALEPRAFESANL